jgi:hypothetical protein
MRAFLAVLSLLFIDLSGGSALAAAGCHPNIDAKVPQYIVGYGSLMEQASKDRTAPNTGANLPVMVTGYERSWHLRGSGVGFGTTYLGVQAKEGALMVAALYRDFARQDISDTDQREIYYCRDEVDPGALRMLDGSAVPQTGQIWIYVSKPEAVDPPDADYPIVQSYVDILMTGCLQLAERVVDQNEDFARQCITTTGGWSPHWVNDRLLPRRPFIHQPNAAEIDRLLFENVPAEFKMIRIE